MKKKIALIISVLVMLGQPLSAGEPNFDRLIEKLNVFMSYIKDEVKDTKEFQINQWTAAKKQKVKELTFVQHKLTGFFSDFPSNKQEDE